MEEHSADVPEQQLPTGTEVYLRYNVAGRVEYRGRLIVAYAYARRYVILTPDDNLYLEDYDASNPDLVAVVAAGADGWPPPEIADFPDTYIHDFTMFLPPVTWARLTAEGSMMAQRACRRAGAAVVGDGPEPRAACSPATGCCSPAARPGGGHLGRPERCARAGECCGCSCGPRWGTWRLLRSGSASWYRLPRSRWLLRLRRGRQRRPRVEPPARTWRPR